MKIADIGNNLPRDVSKAPSENRTLGTEVDLVRTSQMGQDGKGFPRDKQQMQKHKPVEITCPLHPVVTFSCQPLGEPQVSEAGSPSLQGYLLELSSRDLFLKTD